MKQIAKYADLNNQNEINQYAMNRGCINSRKSILCQVYQNYCQIYGLNFEKPKLIIDRKNPYIPTEEDIDALIDALSLGTSIFCQFLKETACRSGEAWMVKWSDIDFQRRPVRITTEKK